MVADDGYLKIIDMGTCKKLEPNSKNGESNFLSQKTFTIIGTPNYMAPEIISGKGYSSTVDLWSLGIVIY
jgi:cGMP-dependent protein kinase